MIIMIIRLNGVEIQKNNYPSNLTPHDIGSTIEETIQIINDKPRELRRSRMMKKTIATLAFLGTLGTACMAHAQGIQSGWSHDGIATQMAKQYAKSKMQGSVTEGNTLIGHADEWMKTCLLHTSNFFDNPQITHIFNTVWGICLSTTVLIVAKKGYDMIRAKILGVSNVGGVELIMRLLASLVMTFISLDVVKWGIEGSNLIMDVFFKNLESNIIPYDQIHASVVGGTLFWMIGYMILFVVLSCQYWVRQITIVLAGCLLPVANMSWVTDRGRMLGTLTMELIVLLATPLTHGLILGITGEMVTGVDAISGGSVFLNGLNKLLIGLSSMFLMLVTPSLLRKFTSGTVNPVKWAWNVSMGIKGNAIKTLGMFK